MDRLPYELVHLIATSLPFLDLASLAKSHPFGLRAASHRRREANAILLHHRNEHGEPVESLCAFAWDALFQPHYKALLDVAFVAGLSVDAPLFYSRFQHLTRRGLEYSLSKMNWEMAVFFLENGADPYLHNFRGLDCPAQLVDALMNASLELFGDLQANKAGLKQVLAYFKKAKHTKLSRTLI
jgi:hypothetical protein